MAQVSQCVDVENIAFLEFSGSKPEKLHDLFLQMGFNWRASDDRKLYNLSEIVFISNPSLGGSAAEFRVKHTRGVSALGFKVADSAQAYQQALALGAEPAANPDWPIPAVQGVGAALIYLVDDHHLQTLFQAFNFEPTRHQHQANSILSIDHLTHNLHIGGVARMREFYHRVFGFSSVRSFDINGKQTGLVSEVVTSRNGRVTIPLNESKDDVSQIAEFVREYNGEGVQHIALQCSDICHAVDSLSAAGIAFQDTPDTYYELVDERLPGHGKDLSQLQLRRILLDGGEKQGGGLLMQIFTQNSIGPIFFEYIQREGNKGFGEGNFQALFESIELDQQRRGVLSR
ncbi:4-hydroxyphenylpyruvate dioxygenase [Halioxenophilus aromaticivorans]|uniref:4-hydroxyphenylpyruvate dioxygenase n=1 Tax=Halioxenophilus aromaticivorans TaxID=1306992 RepID=A0AAV3TZL4_9ALTE